jgi:dihydropteroate synthase
VLGLAPIVLGPSTWSWERVYLVGVINVTPDSFSDGGRHAAVAEAVAFGLRSVAAGADLIDVGGESTRPGARPVSAEEEIERVVPVITRLAEGLAQAGRAVPIAVDTTKAAVARAAVRAGASVVNDIAGGRFDADTPAVAAGEGAAYVCGHVRGDDLAAVHAAEGQPQSWDDVAFELGERVAGLPADLRARTLVDPCLGFGKGPALNLDLLARAGELAAGTGRPVLLGPSRKRFLGALTGKPVGERDDATVGACLAAAAAGAHALRVHDVARVHDALVVFEAVRRGAGRTERRP